MEKRTVKKSGIPKFANEQDEAKWWADREGRAFLKKQRAPVARTSGSPLVGKLVRASSVQIALRLPSPDIEKAGEIAGRKGIGYQTLLKMLVYEGLQRAKHA
jgi:hypothetical protein